METGCKIQLRLINPHTPPNGSFVYGAQGWIHPPACSLLGPERGVRHATSVAVLSHGPEGPVPCKAASRVPRPQNVSPWSSSCFSGPRVTVGGCPMASGPVPPGKARHLPVVGGQQPFRAPFWLPPCTKAAGEEGGVAAGGEQQPGQAVSGSRVKHSFRCPATGKYESGADNSPAPEGDCLPGTETLARAREAVTHCSDSQLREQRGTGVICHQVLGLFLGCWARRSSLLCLCLGSWSLLPPGQLRLLAPERTRIFNSRDQREGPKENKSPSLLALDTLSPSSTDNVRTRRVNIKNLPPSPAQIRCPNLLV
nr:uncharacterized protein LOC112545085 [Pelodiscus sinensis]|eukprot:XP_025038221.1 uncharacterized protein LOC112545085 [Pelodiscus sinensis]